jgi:DNA adenine methylase
MPPHKKYVEIFAGGASILLSKPIPVNGSVYNDADSALVKFHKNFTCRALDRCKKIKDVCGFAKKARTRVRAGSGDICDQIAARRFSIVSDITGGLKAKECQVAPVITKRLEKECPEFEKRLSRTKFENLDYRKSFKKHDAKGVLLLMDPPYPGTVQPYRGDPGAVRPEDVCDLARTARGHVIITYGDTPKVRKACAGLHMQSIPVRHVSKHVTKGKGATHELVITNFPTKRISTGTRR